MATQRPLRPVLVVEDHDDTRDMVEWFLRQDGYVVRAAANGKEALEYVAREPPCLILLDLSMPGMDGATFARLLRAHHDCTLADTPIILLTALPDPYDVQREIGAMAVIAKPISLDQVTSEVARHCPVDAAPSRSA